MSKSSAQLASHGSTLAEVAHEIGHQMAAAEVAIDEAITRVATLMARVPQARMEADLSATVGQPVFDHMGSTISSLTSGRAEMVKVHRLLETLRRELNLPVISYGDKPGGPAQITSEATPRLRAVAP
ncbi:MAG: hypothetical protein JOY99_11380 [Sphingomonadaceae bacterium]|nr:hypothetical protein [Sphingomonadaceae bacterium]